MKDVLTTVGGLLLVAGVVVGTFLYGNYQREEQQRRDQQLTQQREADTQNQKTAQTNPQGGQSGPSGDQQPGVKKPTDTTGQSIQGSGAPNTGQGKQAAQPKPSPSPVPPGTTTTPETGPELAYVLVAGGLVLLVQAQRRSRLALRSAALNRS